MLLRFAVRCLTAVGSLFDRIKTWIPSKSPQAHPQPESYKPRPSHSRLEILPPELKILLLESLPKLKSLHSLSLASKSYHEVYLKNTHRIFRTVLESEVGGAEVLEDARMAIKASRIRMRHAEPFQRLDEFAESWDKAYAGDINPRALSLDELFEIARLQQSVRYFAARYFQQKLRVIPFTEEATSNASPPTLSETRRVHRALYRLDTFCSIFCDPSYEQRSRCETGLSYNSEQQRVSSEDKAIYLSKFYAWEVEEMACMRHFFHEELSNVCGAVREELSIDPPHILEVYPWKPMPTNLPPGFKAVSDDRMRWFDLECDGGIDLEPNTYQFSEIVEARMALGLSYLHELVSASTPADKKKVFFQDLDDWTLNGISFFSDSLQSPPPILLQDSEVLEAFYHQDKEAFSGEEDGPNAGWAWASGSQVEVFYDMRIKKELRLLGYVFWDEARLSDWGVLSRDNSRWATPPNALKGRRLHPEIPVDHDEYCKRLKNHGDASQQEPEKE